VSLDFKLLNYLWTEVRLAQGLPTPRQSGHFSSLAPCCSRIILQEFSARKESRIASAG